MNISDIEDALIAKLLRDLPELEVTAFPERPEEYEFIHPVGAVLVQYDGSNFSAPDIISLADQPRDFNFRVLSMNRNVRDSGGSYDVLQRISRSLLGLKMSTCFLVWQTAEDFVSEDEGVWVYSQSFCVRSRQVQDEPNCNALNNFYDNPLNAIPKNEGGTS